MTTPPALARENFREWIRLVLERGVSPDAEARTRESLKRAREGAERRAEERQAP